MAQKLQFSHFGIGPLPARIGLAATTRSQHGEMCSFGAQGSLAVYYLYASKPSVYRKLVATFDSEQQLLSYVRWATLSKNGGRTKFEQQSALAGYEQWISSSEPLSDDDPSAVDHNPSPTML